MLAWKKWGEWEFQNRGTDARFGGWFGQLLAMMQTLGSWHSTRPPKRLGGRYAAIFWPPFVGLAIPYGTASARRYATFRAGWRWDANWGAGGFILDVIVKGRMPLVPFLVLLAVLLAACGKKPLVLQPTVVEVVRTVTVNVPVPVKVPPPPELLAALTIPLPVFVAPSDPAASSALTAEGERLLRGMIESLMAQIRAWQVWAAAP